MHLMSKLIILIVASFAEPGSETLKHFGLFLWLNDREVNHEHFETVNYQV